MCTLLSLNILSLTSVPFVHSQINHVCECSRTGFACGRCMAMGMACIFGGDIMQVPESKTVVRVPIPVAAPVIVVPDVLIDLSNDPDTDDDDAFLLAHQHP